MHFSPHVKQENEEHRYKVLSVLTTSSGIATIRAYRKRKETKSIKFKLQQTFCLKRFSVFLEEKKRKEEEEEEEEEGLPLP